MPEEDIPIESLYINYKIYNIYQFFFKDIIFPIVGFEYSCLFMQEARQDEDAYDPEPEPEARGSLEPSENPPLPGAAEPHAEPEAVSPAATLAASSSSCSIGGDCASPFIESQWRLEADGSRSSGSPKGGDHQVYIN